MSVAILKLITLLGIIVVLFLPFFPIERFFSFYGTSYKGKYRRNNLVFVLLTAVEVFIICFVLPIIINLINAVKDWKLFHWLEEKIPDRIEYIVTAFSLLLFNVLICVLLLGVKKLVRIFLNKKVFTDVVDEPQKAKRKTNNGKKYGIDKSDNRITQLRKNSKIVFCPSKNKKGAIVYEADVDSDENEDEAPLYEADYIDEDGLSTIQKIWYKAIGLFYLKDTGYTHVKDGTYTWAKQLKIFTYIICVIYALSCVFMLIPAFFSFNSLSWFYKVASFVVENTFIYPILSLISLHEVLFFVDGDMKPESVKKSGKVSCVFGKKQDNVVDLQKMKKELIEEYGDRYGIEYFSTSRTSGKKKSISENQKNVIKNIHDFIQKKNQCVNDGYLKGLDDMLEGAHVLFDSSIYSSLGEYIVHYLFIYLSFGNRALFICKDEHEVEELKEYIEASSKEVINTSSCFWKIGTYNDLREIMIPDILILTPRDFLKEELETIGRAFFEELVDVFICDVDKILMSNNYHCLIMAKKLDKFISCFDMEYVDLESFDKSSRHITYRFFTSGHVRGISESIKHFFDLRRETFEEIHSFDMNSETEVFVWRTGLDDTVFVDKGANQKPLEVVITEIADQNGVPNKNLITESSLYSSHLGEISSLVVNKRHVGSSPFGFIVVEDDRFNLPSAIYDYTRFSGCKKTIVHIVSRPYLLRDFFASKAKKYVQEVDLVGKTMLEHADELKVRIIALLCDAANGIDREEFINEVTILLGEGKELTLTECIKRCYEISVGDLDDSPKYYLTIGTDSKHNLKTYITLKEPQKLYKKLLESTRNAVINYNKTKEYLPIFVNEISQYYIPGQSIVRNNMSYTILGINQEEGSIELDNGVSTINVPDDYIQSRIYTLRGVENRRTLLQDQRSFENVVSRLIVKSYVADVEVETPGYYSINSSVQTINLKNANQAKYIRISDERREEIRRNIKTNVLVCDMIFKGKSDSKLSYTLATILQEFMKTMFPYEYRCISVCPLLEKEEEQKLYDTSKEICDLYPRVVSFEGMGDEPKLEDDEGAIRFVVIEDVDGGNGTVNTLFDGTDIMLSQIFHIVCDYLEWGMSQEDGFKYLYYGYDECPAVFDFNGLYNVVSKLKYNIDRKTGNHFDSKDKCFFCHQYVDSKKCAKLSDERRICEECIDTTTDTYEKLESLFAKVFDAIKQSTTIPETFPDDISIDFISTADLKNRFSNNKNEEHPIAYCNHATKCIYIEYGLSEVAVCAAVAKFITELWQDSNIVNDGSELYSGHPLFVEVQVLEKLKLKEASLVFKGLYENYKGFQELVALLQGAETEDSFAFFADDIGGKKKRGEEPEPVIETIDFVVERNPDSLKRYNRDSLNDDERAVYDQISDTIYNFKPETGPICREITVKKCREILDFFQKDNPEAFWCKRSIGIIHRIDDKASKVVIDYCMSLEEKEKRKKEIEKAITPFVEGITPTMSDYEVALKIFENIVELAEYDHDTLKKEDDGLIPDSAPDDIRSIYGVFVLKKAVCAGYARAFQFILNRLGIECTFVTGRCIKNNEPHAWNLVKIEGGYYYCDVTWGESGFKEPKLDYFCITTEELLRTRGINDAERYPVCTDVKCNYFVRNKLFFNSYDAEKFAAAIMSEVKKGKKLISIKLSNESLYNLVIKKMVEGRGIVDIIEAAGEKTDGYCYQNEKLYIIRFKLV